MRMSEHSWNDQWDKMKALWTEWSPTDEEQKVWSDTLVRYDVYVVDKARQKLFVEAGRFRKPDLKKMVEFANSEKWKQADRAEPDVVEVDEFSMVCVALDTDERGSVGQRVNYSYRKDKAVNVDWVWVCNRINTDLQDIFGGKWILIHGRKKTHDKVRELLKAHPKAIAEANERRLLGGIPEYLANGMRRNTPATRMRTDRLKSRQVLELQQVSLKAELVKRGDKKALEIAAKIPEHRLPTEKKLPIGVKKFNPNWAMEAKGADQSIPF